MPAVSSMKVDIRTKITSPQHGQSSDNVDCSEGIKNAHLFHFSGKLRRPEVDGYSYIIVMLDLITR